MIINHNLNAMNAHRKMSSLTTSQGKAMEKLNSGQRINRAADDAAGLAISEKMRSQIRGLNQASRNAQDGISMIQTAEGALSETQAIGHRMRELAIQSANGIYTDDDRKLIDQEFTELKKEIDRIANETEFNGSKVLNGEKSGKEIVAGNWTTDQNKDAFGTANNKLNKDADLKKAFTNATTADEVKKLGEGNFELRIYVGDDTTQSVVKNISDPKLKEKFDGLKENDIKIELVDKSKFNDGKEYVMDEVTITDKDQDIELYGMKLHLTSTGGLAQIKTGKGLSAAFTFSNTLNDTKKVDGTKLQVGANQDQNIGFDIDYMRARELGLGGIQIDTTANAQEAIGRIDEAITRVSSQRADLGAVQNRLEHTMASADNTAENLQASESRIRDVDMAKEMMNLTKLNILQQSSQAMISQANQAPNQILSLLK